ncbi:MAG: GNAT family N-acetyltransferase [Fibrobacter sp.]|nr:GNAT family N-acetyltransferase [Fibrobacter sp.]
MRHSLFWKPLERANLQTVTAIAHQLHPDLPERLDVFDEKRSLFSQGCKKLMHGTDIVGYGFAHPWYHNKIPALDTFLQKIPDNPDCIYIHDVAILPSAQGKKATEGYISDIVTLAKCHSIAVLTLVSVYRTTDFWKKYGFSIVTNPAINEQLIPYGPTAKYMQLLIG